MIDLPAKVLWNRKVRKYKRRLETRLSTIPSLPPSARLKERLDLANETATLVLESNRSKLKNLWDYGSFSPHCEQYALSTYALFLSMTEQTGRVDLRDNVALALGVAILTQDLQRREYTSLGFHATLRYRRCKGWTNYETVPENREVDNLIHMPFTFFQVGTEGVRISFKSGRLIYTLAGLPW